MNLRQKVLITLSFAFLVIILVLVFISFTFLISSYSKLEMIHVQEDLIQTTGKFHDVLSAMSSIAHDWGPWDDTVAFVHGNAPNYLHSNLQPYGFDNLDLNLIAITNTNGEVLYAGAYDLQNKTMVTVPVFFSQRMDLRDPLMNMTDPSSTTAGILMLPEGPMFVVSQPVMYSNFSGSPHGVIIMGRYLNNEQTAKIASLTQPTLTFRRISDSPLPGNLMARLQRDPGPFFGVVEPLNSETVAGYTLIKDIYGNDALVLEITEPRDIYRQGITTILSFLFLLALLAFIIGIVVLVLVDRLVLSRISALQNNVDLLGNRGDLTLRLVNEGDDEISRLTSAINSTLDSLENATKSLQQSEAGYLALIETIPVSIAQVDLSGTILYCNHQMAAAHGCLADEDLKGKFLFHFITPADRDRAMKCFAGTIKDHQTRIAEFTALKRDRSEFWVEMSISPVPIPGGVPESCIVVMRDISLRKIWESQMKESEERYRAVFENTGTATVIVEEDTIISLANSEFERLSGYVRAEIEGKRRWTDFVVKDDLDRMLVQHAARRTHSPAAIRKYEFRFITKSGDTRDILLCVDMIPGTMKSIASLMDITERKQAEIALLESEIKLNSIIDSSPFPQFVIDKNHAVIHWNKALEQMSGIPASTVIGTDRHWTAFYPGPRPCIADLVVDDTIEKIPDFYSGKYVRNNVLPEVYEVTDFFPDLGDGGKWLFFSSRRIRDHLGNITGAIETLVDITERKKAEEKMLRANEQLTAAVEELRATEETLRDNITELQEAKRDLQKSEAKYRDITAHIPGIVFQFVVHGTEDFSIPFISDKIIRMFTLGPDEIYSNPDALFNLIHPDDVEYVRSTLLESARIILPWNVEFRMKAKGTESPRWFNGRALPHMLDRENILWDGVLLDITERKQAESALVESEHRFRAIFDQTFEFIGLLTPDGTLVEANRAALAFSGVEESEVLGKPFWETCLWQHSEEMQARVKDGIRQAVLGEFVRFEATLCRSDGVIRHVDFSLKPVQDEKGSVVLIIPEAHDITDQKVLEGEIRAALREKEMLLKEIHHRVKNNIQVIASLLNMQSRTVDDLNTKEVLREAQNRVKSIALVHEKLYQSKSLDRIDYHDYLQKISRHLYESYGVSPRTIVMHIHAENISLHIDKAIPCSLIINELLTNAFKHAFPRGRYGDIWIDLFRQGDSLVLMYRDNGVGLPQDLLIEQSESLGMRLLHGLTHQLHGTIEVQRLEGTRFIITFPVEPGKEQAP